MSTPAGPAGSQQEEPGQDTDEIGRRFAEGDRLLDATEVAGKLGGTMTAKTVKRQYRTWGLPAHRIGKELRFWENDVHDYIQRHRRT